MCQFHLLCQSWTLEISSLGGNSSNKILFIKNLYNWCSSWFYDIETEDELNISVKEFFIHVRSDEVFYNKNKSIVLITEKTQDNVLSANKIYVRMKNAKIFLNYCENNQSIEDEDDN